MNAVTYLRKGRKLRASGVIVHRARVDGLFKVKPDREDWGHIWITDEEIAAGQGKPIPRAKREKPAEQPKRQRKTKPKAARMPRWREMIAEVRMLELDPIPDALRCIKFSFVSELANELEAAHARLANFLPVTND